MWSPDVGARVIYAGGVRAYLGVGVGYELGTSRRQRMSESRLHRGKLVVTPVCFRAPELDGTNFSTWK